MLVTGGTKGLGLAIGRAFARQGARCILTYNFGSADEDEIRQAFIDDGSLSPLIVQADVASATETRALLSQVAAELGPVDVFISNAAAALIIRSMDDFTERGLLQSVRGSVWPTMEYLLQMRRICGRYPRYVVAISSTGPDAFSVQYDYVAACKSMLETLCKYVSHRLRDEDVNVNAIRTMGVLTDSLDATFGAEMKSFVSQFVEPSDFIRAEEVAGAVLALCSGLMDGVQGQIITVDRGLVFQDNITHLFQERHRLGLAAKADEKEWS